MREKYYWLVGDWWLVAGGLVLVWCERKTLLKLASKIFFSAGVRDHVVFLLVAAFRNCNSRNPQTHMRAKNTRRIQAWF